MRRFVIGTAGHVDHGKTALVRALTGVDTDRLPEEKKRGISIELGFALLELGEVRASIVDVPGHRRLVRTMIAGAAGMELVMLVVAADEGVMPQTREHVAVCELLGLERAVIVVNKADVVEPDLAALAAEEARALLAPPWRADLVVCSARTGEGIDRLRRALLRALSSLPARVGGAPVRVGVDRVFSVRGAGTVITGTMVAGQVSIGDPLWLVRSGAAGGRAVETSARGLQVHDAVLPYVEAPTRVAINLSGLTLEDARRGDVVTADPHLRATSLVDALLRGAHALRRGAAVTVHAGTASTEARVDSLLTLPDCAIARLRLLASMPVAGGDRVVLRGGAGGVAGAVAGGGVVIDARPDRRASGARRRGLLAALSTLDLGVSARALVEACAPRPLLRATLPSRFAVDAEALGRAADGDPSLVRVGNDGWVGRPQMSAAIKSAREFVLAHHERAPLERGLPLETLRARLAIRAGRLVAAEVIRLASIEGPAHERIVLDGDVVRASQGPAPAGARLAAGKIEAVASALQNAALAGASEFILAQQLSTTSAELRQALQRLAREGGAVRLGDLWFAAEVVAEARLRLLAHFAASSTLSVAQFKGLAGLARRQAVAILEHFDELGLTRRQGDARVLR